MKLWLDVHLPPALVPWLKRRHGLDAEAFRDAELTQAADEDVFKKLRNPGDVVMTKDSDFVRLVEASGPPPQVIWLAFGNSSNANLRRILDETLSDAIELLKDGEAVVEIRDR